MGTRSTILELFRQIVVVSNAFDERPDLASRILGEFKIVEDGPDRIHGDEFKIVMFILICCAGLANIGGVDATALLAYF